MERDPGDFEKRDGAFVSDANEDAQIDALLESLPPPAGIKYIDDPDDDDVAEALADVAAGRCYSHEIVGRWLKTAGHPDWKPFEEWLAQLDG